MTPTRTTETAVGTTAVRRAAVTASCAPTCRRDNQGMKPVMTGTPWTPMAARRVASAPAAAMGWCGEGLKLATTETMSRPTLAAPTASALAAVTRSFGQTSRRMYPRVKPVTMATTTTPMTASAASAHAAGMGRFMPGWKPAMTATMRTTTRASRTAWWRPAVTASFTKALKPAMTATTPTPTRA